MSHAILALDSSGTPKSWLSYERAAFYYAKGLVNWSIGDIKVLRGGIQRSTGKQSKLAINSIISISGLHKQFNRIPRLTNKALFARDWYICAYCGLSFDNYKLLTRDHIVPVSKGGKNKWNNVVTACKKCNNRKGDNLIQNTNMELRYIPYTPDIAEHLILSNKRILADQMEFLVKAITNKNSRVFDHVEL